MKPLAEALTVLIDEDVWPEFQSALAQIGGGWTAASGRVYRLRLSGRRLEVDLHLGDYELPAGREIDRDLFELACELQDRVGEPWSSRALREMVALWSPDGSELL